MSPRPFPQRMPRPDEWTPAQRVMQVHDSLIAAQADAERLPEAEAALSELLAGDLVGDPPLVNPDALDDARADVARCTQARGLVPGLQRRLVQAIEAYRSAEHDRLKARMDAADEDARHHTAALQALQAQAKAVGEKLMVAKAKTEAARGVWAALPHRSHEQLLREILAKQAQAAEAAA